MVRRHTLTPAKFQVYDPSEIMQNHRDSVARILPKPTVVTHNTVKNNAATIHFKSLSLKSLLLKEALAAQMMPPPPPPGPPLPTFKSSNLVGVASDVLIPQEGEIEFYKNDADMKNGGGSNSSGESANNDDFEEDLSIVSDLGKCHFFHSLPKILGVLEIVSK